MGNFISSWFSFSREKPLKGRILLGVCVKSNSRQRSELLARLYKQLPSGNHFFLNALRFSPPSGAMKYTYQGYKVCYKHILITFANARRWGNSCCLLIYADYYTLTFGHTKGRAADIISAVRPAVE